MSVSVLCAAEMEWDSWRKSEKKEWFLGLRHESRGWGDHRESLFVLRREPAVSLGEMGAQVSWNWLSFDPTSESAFPFARFDLEGFLSIRYAAVLSTRIQAGLGWEVVGEEFLMRPDLSLGEELDLRFIKVSTEFAASRSTSGLFPGPLKAGFSIAATPWSFFRSAATLQWEVAILTNLFTQGVAVVDFGVTLFPFGDVALKAHCILRSDQFFSVLGGFHVNPKKWKSGPILTLEGGMNALRSADIKASLAFRIWPKDDTDVLSDKSAGKGSITNLTTWLIPLTNATGMADLDYLKEVFPNLLQVEIANLSSKLLIRKMEGGAMEFPRMVTILSEVDGKIILELKWDRGKSSVVFRTRRILPGKERGDFQKTAREISQEWVQWIEKQEIFIR